VAIAKKLECGQKHRFCDYDNFWQ